MDQREMRSVARLLPGAHVRLCTSVYRLMPGKTSPEPTHSPKATRQASCFSTPAFWPQVGTTALKGLLQRRALQRRRKCWAPRVTRACGFPSLPSALAAAPASAQETRPPEGGRASTGPPGPQGAGGGAGRARVGRGRKERPARGRESLCGLPPACAGARSR